MKPTFLALVVLLSLGGNGWAQSPEPAAPPATETDAAKNVESTGEEKVVSEEEKPKSKLNVSLRKSTEEGQDRPRNGFYVGAFGGLNIGDNAGMDTENELNGNASEFSMETGSALDFTAGLKLGYSYYSKDKSFDEVQWVPSIELEVGYLSSEVEATGQGTGAGSELDADLEVVTVCFNACMRLHNRILVPYLGFGGGLGHVRVKSVSGTINAPPDTESVVTVRDDSQYVPVFQGIAGLEREITPNLVGFAEYKPLFIPDATFEAGLSGAPANNAVVDMENLLLHQFAFGLRYHF
jgi:opacity protein-like surface antigen